MRNNSFLSNDFKANDAQLEAIRHTEGPAIVLAGPGSGKTKVITERVKYLIEQKDIAPSSILVITFTKAAALEMQHRFFTITDSSYPDVSFGTFHSVFYHIIKSSLSKNDSLIEIANDGLKKEILKDIILDLGYKNNLTQTDIKDITAEIPDIISEISRVKNLGIAPELCSRSLNSKDLFPDIFVKYSDRLKEFGKIDFDDMIFRCHEILLKNKKLLSAYQNKFKYILVDEYQDINPMQYKVLRLLLGDSNNIFAVGDDDQSIYGFRGSSPEIMLGFKEEFAKFSPREIFLNINYRSGKDILSCAQKVISGNTKRYEKKMEASLNNPAGKVIVRRYDNRDREYTAIAEFLKKHVSDLENTALLFRTNSEAEKLRDVLNSYGIRTSMDDVIKKVYSDKGVTLLRDYISFACLGNKRCDYIKIINKPMRYISRESANKEIVYERDVVKFYAYNKKRNEEVKKFFRQINMIRGLRPFLAVKFLRKSLGLDNLYPESREALAIAEKEAEKFFDNKDFVKYIDEMAQSEENRQKENKTRQIKSGRVNIMTMHTSKGLEFDTVWLPDLNEGVIPSRNAVTIDQTEEERRMLYVAMTRAKKALIMSYVTGSENSPMLPSRFLRPIKYLWENTYHSPDSSSGRSMSSSNSTSSR